MKKLITIIAMAMLITACSNKNVLTAHKWYMYKHHDLPIAKDSADILTFYNTGTYKYEQGPEHFQPNKSYKYTWATDGDEILLFINDRQVKDHIIYLPKDKSILSYIFEDGEKVKITSSRFIAIDSPLWGK